MPRPRFSSSSRFSEYFPPLQCPYIVKLRAESGVEDGSTMHEWLERMAQSSAEKSQKPHGRPRYMDFPPSAG
jgi:hypothetical protein